MRQDDRRRPSSATGDWRHGSVISRRGVDLAPENPIRPSVYITMIGNSNNVPRIMKPRLSKATPRAPRCTMRARQWTRAAKCEARRPKKLESRKENGVERQVLLRRAQGAGSCWL